MDFSILKEEIGNDPMGMGYAKMIELKSDQGVADLLNAPTKDTVIIDVMDKGTFILNILPIIDNLLTNGSQELKDKWFFYLDLLKSVEQIHIAHPSIQALLGALVQDKIALDEQLSFTKRAASRAEILFGDGVKITNSDISMLLRGY